MDILFKRAASFLDRAPELWKENVELVELNRRFLWFLILRFGVIAALFFLGLTKSIIIPHLTLATSVCFTVAGILFVLNIFYWFYYEWAITYHGFPVNARMVAENVQIQMIIDFLILGYIVYECGGIESPLIYFFLFHNILSCLFFRKIVSFIYTMLSIGIIAFIYFMSYWGLLPEKHFIDQGESAAIFAASREHAHYYLAGVISIYLVSWYLISAITYSLRVHERQLQTKMQEMIDLAREKNRYLLVTTHELKAPFAAIQSYVNVALEGYAGDLSDKLKDILWKIRVRCITLTNMITEMIQLTNITSIKENRQEITRSRLDLCEAIRNTLPRFKDMAAAKGVTFDTASLARPHFVEANGQQLDILFNNILVNSISYSRPGTKVIVSMEDKDQSVIVCMRDHGIGIKKEHLEKVFLEHFRTEKAVELNPNSTGLGLTIARQIMDIHDGRIWIESAEGEGTSVFMEFPVSPT